MVKPRKGGPTFVPAKPRNGHASPSGADPNLVETVKTGTYRQQLEALRDKLAVDLESCPPGVVPQHTSQLRAVLKDLAALPDGKVVSKADELARRRADRRAATAAAASAAGDRH